MPIVDNIEAVKVVITGTQPLVMDNIEHADPEDPLAREIKEITDKGRDMTDEDRKRKDRLAYQAALYLGEVHQGQLVVPWALLSRALRTGAFRVGGASASGKVDGIETSSMEFPLLYEGPKASQLYEDERFKLRKMVNKNPTGKKAMVPYVRPYFPKWGFEAELFVLNDVISFEMFERVLAMTGKVAGIGNARKLGYGRFTATVARA